MMQLGNQDMNKTEAERDRGNSDFEERVREALRNPRNVGEIQDADAVGTVGSPDCGDMLRMWLKFRQDKDGRKVIDKASFQTFGCETAIAVASIATELLEGLTPEQAIQLSGNDLASPLGPLPPMKIHCAQLVEGALRSALGAETDASPSAAASSQTLLEQLSGLQKQNRKIVFKQNPAS